MNQGLFTLTTPSQLNSFSPRHIGALLACALPPLLMLGTGCGTTRPIARWQDRLTEYVAEEGRGDPNVLRDMHELRSPDTLRPAWIRFSEIDVPGSGIPRWATRYDVHGILLGRQGDDTFVFLVGVVRRPTRGPSRLEEIRIAAWNPAADGWRWRFSEPDPRALREYLTGHSHSGPSNHQTFPRLDDDFRLDAVDGLVRVTDAKTGAHWTLRVPGDSRPGLTATPLRSVAGRSAHAVRGWEADS